MKAFYQKPRIGGEVCLYADATILAASVVDLMTVTSTGQEVTDHDFTDDTFNSDWEN